jgi:hypothetical protein
VRRLVTLARRVLGLALWVWAGWQLYQAVMAWFGCRWPGNPEALVAADAETGAVLGFRISPLTPAEADAARDRERAAFTAAWRELLERESGGVDRGL